jgi:TRAP-type C4-dicarboxylate transport system permease small subunit
MEDHISDIDHNNDLMGQVDQLNYVYVSIPISLAVISIFFVKKLFEKSEQIDDNIDIGHYLKLGLVSG